MTLTPIVSAEEQGCSLPLIHEGGGPGRGEHCVPNSDLGCVPQSQIPQTPPCRPKLTIGQLLQAYFLPLVGSTESLCQSDPILQALFFKRCQISTKCWKESSTNSTSLYRVAIARGTLRFDFHCFKPNHFLLNITVASVTGGRNRKIQHIFISVPGETRRSSVPRPSDFPAQACACVCVCVLL